LNAETFTQTFTAEWHAAVRLKLSAGQLDDLVVNVVAASRVMIPADRETDQNDIEISIGIQKKIGTRTTDRDENVEIMCGFVEEIVDALSRLQLPGIPSQYIGIQNDPIYDTEQLVEDSVFTSVVTVTYRTMTE
jgi:hypothetical protein